MADNYNIDLNAAAQGASAANSLGSTIAQNAQTQLEHSQLVAQAFEKTKQAQIATKEQQTEFDTGAYLSKQGLMQKQQALGQLKIVMQKQGMSDADQDSIMQTAEQTFPDEMDGTALWRWFSALREPKAVAATRGATFQATPQDVASGQKDSSGNPVVEGQGYITDTDGNWIRSGPSQDQLDAKTDSKKEASDEKAAAKKHDSDEKTWRQLGGKIQAAISGRYGVVGQVGTTITRADRAINTLNHAGGADGMLTKQDLENLSTDIAAIYQGGVPGVTQIVENSYGTTLTNMVETLRHYTGFIAHLGNTQVLADTKTKLMGVLTDMRNSGLAQIGKFVEMQFPAYREIIQEDPERWEQEKEAVTAFMSSGLLNSSGQVMPPTGGPPMAPVGAAATPAPAPVASAATQTTKSGTVYSVNP